MFTKKSATLAATGLIAGLLVSYAGVSPAEAASAVRIAAVQYDSPGTDTGSNKSLNAEWVRITNHSSKRKSLTGWTLRDTSHHVYRFGKFSLGPGKSVRIHTGKGKNTATNRYQGRSWYVWNNDGDKATLKNAAGTTVAARRW